MNLSERYYSTVEAAYLLNLSPEALRKQVQAGKVPGAVKVHARLFLFDKDVFNKYLAERSAERVG
jgi:excisionase family DNA binding protein